MESSVNIFLSKAIKKHMSSQKVFTSRHGLFVQISLSVCKTLNISSTKTCSVMSPSDLFSSEFLQNVAPSSLRDKIKLNFSDQCLFSRPTPDSSPQVVYITSPMSTKFLLPNFFRSHKNEFYDLLSKSSTEFYKLVLRIRTFAGLTFQLQRMCKNDISSHETLNQIDLLFCCRMPHNTVAQSTANSLFTAKFPNVLGRPF